MSGHEHISKRLKKLSEPKTFDLDPAAFAQTISSESDRGAIILAVTAIDDALRIRLANKFDSTTSGDEKALFGFNGAAGTFSSRILLAKALGIIEAGTQRRIDLLRNLRNACAHAQNELTFDSPVVREVVEYMTLTADPPIAELPRFRVRDAFISMCLILASSIRTAGTYQEAFDRIRPIVEPLARETLQTAVDLAAAQSKGED